MKTYRIIFIYLLSLTISIVLNAQSDGVSIGVGSPHKSAILHIQPPSDNKGLLIPRLSSNPVSGENTLRNIEDPTDGLLAYDTYKKGFVYWDESLPDIPADKPDKWVEILPTGLITMWSGNLPPSGWALCDGNNGTPDLRGRFIVSSGQNSLPAIGDTNPSYVINSVGGRNGVLLSESETPLPNHNHDMSHGHSITDPGHVHSMDFRGDPEITPPLNAIPRLSIGPTSVPITTTSSTTGVSVNSITQNTGNASKAAIPHENRPPYYVLAFIMKL